ncbi:MAG TPA: SRPBCC domain-containing protein [Gemmatimonadaceae bacterium]|jgi:uncharacterized protein YndB with AHSA1/START domain
MTAPSESAAGTRHKTVYSTPSERELVVVRTFDAPRSIVWSAFTDPKHVPHWHTGPDGFTMPRCEIDLRPGGSFHYGWRNAHGREFDATGTYREVDPPNRLVTVTNRDGEENCNTTTFTEENGRTTVTVSLLFASQASRDKGIPYTKIGTDTNYARLDDYLATERTKR